MPNSAELQKSELQKTDFQNSDEEIIKNLELLINLEVLEEPDLWDDLAGLDAPDILESEK